MKSKTAFPAIGASALICIFAVLCLTVFSLLSISTVLSEQRLGDAAFTAVTDYYEADCRAEEILSLLREGKNPGGIHRDGDIYEYNCAISDTQTLAVRVLIQGAQYEILRWQAVSVIHWEAEDKLPVWTGEA